MSYQETPPTGFEPRAYEQSIQFLPTQPIIVGITTLSLNKTLLWLWEKMTNRQILTVTLYIFNK